MLPAFFRIGMALPDSLWFVEEESTCMYDCILCRSRLWGR
jgi:hypothetical protein